MEHFILFFVFLESKEFMAPNETNKSYADKLEFKQDYLSQEKTDLNFLIVTWVSSDQAKKFSLGLHGL